jgi:hypothetical protein
MSDLRPIHRSGSKSPSFAPRDMSRINLPHEYREFIEGLALDIFTDMTNAGCSLQSTLAAIYLSGSENALMAVRGRTT